jgi:hypothetical protein
LEVCPGSDPLAAAAAVPRPKAAKVAAAAILAVNKRDSTELLLGIDVADGSDEATAAAMAATRRPSRATMFECGDSPEVCTTCTSAASPA